MANRVPPATPELLLKVSKCLVHCGDYLSEGENGGDPADLAAAHKIWTDPEVIAWLASIHRLGLLPIKAAKNVSRETQP